MKKLATCLLLIFAITATAQQQLVPNFNLNNGTKQLNVVTKTTKKSNSYIVSGTIHDNLTKKTLEKTQLVVFKKNKPERLVTNINEKRKGTTISQKTKYHRYTSTYSSETGTYEIELKPGEEYKIVATLNGFDSNVKHFNTLSESKKQIPISFEMKNQEIFYNKKKQTLLKIDEIQFEINQSEISNSSKVALEKVRDLLNKYELMEIEIGVHTSSLGNDGSNLILSESRAQAIYEHLSAIGIEDIDRVSFKGYGETNLLNDCSNGMRCRPSQHSKNRRVEFVVLKNYGKHINRINAVSFN